MYKHLKRIIIAICIWAGIAVMCILPAVVFWGISFDAKTYETIPNPLAMRICFILLALATTVPFIMFWVKTVQLLIINHMNNLFEADADGFVPVSEMARAMGTSEAKVIKKVTGAIRKGYIVNVNYSAAQKAFLLSDKIADSSTRFKGQGAPPNNPFVGVNCPTCAAALKIRANTQGVCPFCGRQLFVPYNDPNQAQ